MKTKPERRAYLIGYCTGMVEAEPRRKFGPPEQLPTAHSEAEDIVDGKTERLTAIILSEIGKACYETADKHLTNSRRKR